MGNTAQQHRIAIGCFHSSRNYKRSSSRSASECILDVVIVILLCLAFEGMTISLCVGLMLLLLAGDIEQNPGPMGDQLLLEGQVNDKIKNVMVTCSLNKLRYLQITRNYRGEISDAPKT